MAEQAMDIDYVARLARLELSPEERTTFAAQLQQVLGYVEQLQEVNVSGVEPTAHAFPVVNVWGADVPRAGLSTSEALANAPAQRAAQVVVPKVVEEA